jgi:outer membrane protein assembly factor BamB
VSRRAWLIGLMALALVAATAFAYVRSRETCGESVTSLSASESSSPFLDAEQREEQPDRDRDALVRTLEGDPAPIGEVVGAVGYHYEQWAQLSAYAQGIGVRTRGNPDFTMLDDETLRPRWSVQVSTKQSTYDASDERYLVRTTPTDSAPDLVALDADDGRRVWCVTLGDDPLRPDDPFATQILPGEDVAVLGPATGAKERIARLSADDGAPRWERTLDADSGDFLGDMGDDTLLAGGREQFRLFDPESVGDRPAGTSLVLLSARDGETIWTERAPAGSDVHVLGADPESGIAVVQEWSVGDRSTRLRAIDSRGNQEWTAVPAKGAYFDATLRAGRVLVRARNQWSAYDLEDGSRLWRRSVPARPQFLPYGFELDSVPLLDPDHVLIGGTAALHTLDLRTGEMTSAALPTDGINTTYWPYQVAVSDRLIAVATNTGAVVVRRE